MRIVVAVLVALVSHNGMAQLSFKTVDSLTYKFYLEQDWESLTAFEKEHQSHYDFFFFNVRLGIAHYESGHFYKAESFFKHALSQNSTPEYLYEYLYWIYLQTGRSREANLAYERLSESTRTQIEIAPGIFQPFFYEFGLKISNKQDSVGMGGYTLLGANHRVNSWLSISENYSYFSQKIGEDVLRQHQYVLSPQVSLKKGFKLGLVAGFFDFSRSIDQMYLETEKISQTENQTTFGLFRLDSTGSYESLFGGEYNQESMNIQFIAEKTLRGIRIKPQLSLLVEWASPNYMEVQNTEIQLVTTMDGNQIASNSTTFSDTTEHKQSTKQHYIQVGAGLEYTYRFNKLSNITLGTEVQGLLKNDELGVYIAPYTNIYLKRKLSFSAYYLQKGAVPVSFFSGALMLTHHDEIFHRVGVTGRYQISRRVSLSATYLHEDVVDQNSSLRYGQNSGVLGITIKL